MKNFRGIMGIYAAAMAAMVHASAQHGFVGVMRKQNWSGNLQQIHTRNGSRECARRLAFKERHGHFA